MFIALEGIDGAGKTATVMHVGRLLRDLGHPVTTFLKQRPEVHDPYVERHLDQLRKLIWQHPPEDPYYLLGDYHWIHLVASWFAAVRHCAINPLIENGRTVLVDNWIHKGLARLKLNPAVDYPYVEEFFLRAGVPDLVVLLDLPIEEAADRKGTMTAIEAGNIHSDIGINRANFIAYQTRLRTELYRFAEAGAGRWSIVDMRGRDLAAGAAAVAGAIHEVLAATAVRG